MKFIIYGNPIPKKRPRFKRIGSSVFTYDVDIKCKQRIHNEFKLFLKEAFSSENKEIVMEASKIAQANEFILDVCFYLPIAESDSNGLKNAKLWGFEPCNHKPDLSNMLKFYEDCANNVLFKDDCQIISCYMKKKYSKNPRTEIEIMPNKDFNLSDEVKSILKILSPEELEELIEDAKKIACLDKGFYQEAAPDIKSEWLISTASVLNNFAQKHSEKIKKMSKFNIPYKPNLSQKKTYLLY